MSAILDLVREVRLADVVDIALVTTLLYTAIVLLRRTQAGFVAIGLMMLGALYIAARAVDLRLTAWILQGFFAVFLVIIVVIFQEELRQLFERIALWSLRRGSRRPVRFDSLDVVVKVLSDFARARVGALLVIPGRQPIDRHVQGGIELDGRLSEPLLKSLFDVHSPGHDGAAIIEQDRIKRFAVHLPLSTNFVQLTRVGTRHSAALGLAELTDALCLVVSEERGQISIAHDGKLQQLFSAQELTGVLQKFMQDTHPSQQGRKVWWELLRENWVEKVAALALVLGLWYLFVPGSRPAIFTYDVPVNVQNLPPEYVLQQVDPPKVKLVFSGLRRAFYLFDPGRLSVTIDASLVKVGRRTFAIDDEDVRYPKELSLQEIDPPRVRIAVQQAENEGKGGEKRAAGDGEP
jgi:diadenylate cyclase